MRQSAVVALAGVLVSGTLGCADAPIPFGNAGERVTSPSFVLAPSTLDVERLATVDDCASCHTDAASHWAQSVHARSSFDNPWYRVSVDEFREARGNRASRFCAGCHDPVLLATGGIDGDVDPDNDLAYAGITCTTCHSVESAGPDGNGSYTLSDRSILIPDPAVPSEIDAHRRRLSLTPLRTEALCGSCHRSFTGAGIGNAQHLAGIDDLGHWRESAFGHGAPDHRVTVDAKRCQDCHMATEAAVLGDLGANDGRIRNHRWAASHTALAAQLAEPALERAVESLRAGVVVDIGAVLIGGRRTLLPQDAKPKGAQTLTFDVLIENEGVGHRFPGGTRDMHDVWLEVVVTDGRGRVLGASRPEGDSRDEVYVLRSTLLDKRGDPELLHRVHDFSTVAFDRTLAPHATQLVRYDMRLPKTIHAPLRLDVRLVHRKHSPAFQKLACEASRSPRGRAFLEGSVARHRAPLDPCLPQPVTVIAEATDWLDTLPSDAKRIGGSARPTSQRWLGQARGLLGETQERVGLVRVSLDPILEDAGASDELEARAALLLARMLEKQGRVDDAIAAVERAERRVGASPVSTRLRADAFARAWRWEQALPLYKRVAQDAPRSATAWRDLARAAGSLGRDAEALAAAERGLALSPRDEDLLRSRALALRGLGHPDAELAEHAWLEHRTPDATSPNLARCERKHVRCQTDRQPIPRYSLVPPPRKAIHASAVSR